MRFYKYLYLSEDLVKKKRRIIRKLKKKKVLMDVYLVCISRYETGQLEILNSLLLLQPDYEEEDLYIVAIVKGYDSALQYVEEITNTVYNETRDADIRSYIYSREQVM